MRDPSPCTFNKRPPGGGGGGGGGGRCGTDGAGQLSHNSSKEGLLGTGMARAAST